MLPCYVLLKDMLKKVDAGGLLVKKGLCERGLSTTNKSVKVCFVLMMKNQLSTSLLISS
jgi:hypothetical protein